MRKKLQYEGTMYLDPLKSWQLVCRTLGFAFSFSDNPTNYIAQCEVNVKDYKGILLNDLFLNSRFFYGSPINKWSVFFLQTPPHLLTGCSGHLRTLEIVIWESRNLDAPALLSTAVLIRSLKNIEKWDVSRCVQWPKLHVFENCLDLEVPLRSLSWPRHGIFPGAKR